MYPLDHQQVLHSFWRDDRYNLIGRDIRMKAMYVRLLVLGLRDYIAEQAPCGTFSESQFSCALDHACTLTGVSASVSRGDILDALINRGEFARCGVTSLRVTDWYAHTGRAERRRVQDRVRKGRERKKMSRGRHADVTRLKDSSIEESLHGPVGLTGPPDPCVPAEVLGRGDIIDKALVDMGVAICRKQ